MTKPADDDRRDATGALTRPTRELVDFCWYIHNPLAYAPDICIDVGAAGGTPAINRVFKNAEHLAFEPLPSFIPSLENELKNNKHEIFQMALMEEPGSMEIAIPDNQYTASLMSKKGADGQTRITVEVSTLDIVLAERVKGKKVFLKTDCQGADLGVVKGGTEVLKHCDVVIMETSLYRFWGSHHPDFYDIVSYMKTQGFVVFDILGGLFKPSNRALGQVDLAFVKEDGPFRPHHRW